MGLARSEGKVYFVPWALPGDEIDAKVEVEHANYSEASIVKITKKSSERVKAPCQYFLNCGGCRLQHLDYDAQLRWKKVIVEDALSKIPKNKIECEDVLPSPKIWNYRNRIQVHHNRQGQWGFYESKSHHVIEIDECLIAEENLNDQLRELKKIKAKGSQTAELSVKEQEGFTQVNTSQNEVLIAKILEFVQPTAESIILDVYCGSGNFTIPLAAKAKKVIGLEKSRDALTEAQQKAAASKIGNIQWRQGIASRLLYQCVQEEISFDAMVLDPPRRGLEEALKFVVQLKIPLVVLVSCEPATFARDAAGLIAAGYQFEKIQPLDMFPHTPHVEVVGVFRRD